MEKNEIKPIKKNKILNLFRCNLSFLVIVGVTILCFLPTEVFILLRWFLNPTGFWQNFAIFGAGVLLLGGFQIFGLIFWLMFILSLLSKDKDSFYPLKP